MRLGIPLLTLFSAVAAAVSAAPAPVAAPAPPPALAERQSQPTFPQPPGERNINAAATWDDIRGVSDLSRWILDYHNQFRAQFGSPPLQWDGNLAFFETMHTFSCNNSHWGNDNLAWYSTTGPASYPVNQLIDMWAGEWVDHYNPPREVYDHFSAMVWASATNVGCSWSLRCRDGDWPNHIYFTCRYGPVVNLLGQYAENVGAFRGS
ncbi:Secreted protein PRY1 [Vanrija pseudolonga]|uniref:Secreted protein PRY1 n=1 Tax=Vanrija pseudolonga TaxID=143232 RepID=A0AAF0YAE3_9TREE|nr:Secreted protein PRY1 [Vanrija pseudolonga]